METCPKCKKLRKLTKHHIFDYHQVKRELDRIYIKPKTDEEHKQYQKMIKALHKQVPKIMICEGCHVKIESGKKPIKVRRLWT